MTEPYSVLLTESPRVDVRPVSRAVAKLRKQMLIDVTTHLRNALGVVYRDLDRETAEEMVRIFDASGQPARAMPTANLIELPAAMRVKRAAIYQEELVIWVPRSVDPVGVPWEQVALLSMGVIRLYEPEMDVSDAAELQEMIQMGDVAEARDHLKAQLADKVLSFGQSESVLPPQTGEELIDSKVGKLPLDYHVDLILGEPLFAIRLSAHQFNFEDLPGAGNSSLQNFHKLLTMISEFATRARRSEAFERFLTWQTVEKDLFEDVRAFEANTRWLVQVWLPELGDAADSAFAGGEEASEDADEDDLDDLDDLPDDDDDLPDDLEDVEPIPANEDDR